MNTNAESSPTQLTTKQRDTKQVDTKQRDTEEPYAEESTADQPDAEHHDTASSGNAETDQENTKSWRTRFEIAAMTRTPRQKQWTIPPQADKGPVHITVRLPEVQVDDSGGRHILIGPEQADVLGSRLIGIRDWLQEGHDDWVGDDDQER